jgi:hypothetical protein
MNWLRVAGVLGLVGLRGATQRQELNETREQNAYEASLHLLPSRPSPNSTPRSWYLLTPPELRKTPRIAAFVDCVLEDTQALRTALVG